MYYLQKRNRCLIWGSSRLNMMNTFNGISLLILYHYEDPSIPGVLKSARITCSQANFGTVVGRYGCHTMSNLDELILTENFKKFKRQVKKGKQVLVLKFYWRILLLTTIVNSCNLQSMHTLKFITAFWLQTLGKCIQLKSIQRLHCTQHLICIKRTESMSGILSVPLHLCLVFCLACNWF